MLDIETRDSLLAVASAGSVVTAAMAAPPMRTSRRDGKLFPVESCLVTVSFLSAAIRSHSVEPGCKLCEALFFSALLSGDPLTNVGRTKEEFDAFCLTDSEEANHIHVHQTHLVQVQRNPRCAALDLRLQFLQMIGFEILPKMGSGSYPKSFVGESKGRSSLAENKSPKRRSGEGSQLMSAFAGCTTRDTFVRILPLVRTSRVNLADTRLCTQPETGAVQG